MRRRYKVALSGHFFRKQFTCTWPALPVRLTLLPWLRLATRLDESKRQPSKRFRSEKIDSLSRLFACSNVISAHRTISRTIHLDRLPSNLRRPSLRRLYRISTSPPAGGRLISPAPVRGRAPDDGRHRRDHLRNVRRARLVVEPLARNGSDIR